MEPINHIHINENVFPTQVIKKRDTAPKKHITLVSHYLTPSGEYDGSNIAYRWSYTNKWIYTNTNIFTNEEFNWLVPSFNRRSSVIRGAHIYYYTVSDKTSKKKKHIPKTNTHVTLGENIIVDLEQPHYSLDENDHEYFKLNTCYSYNSKLFPATDTGERETKWVQRQLRPCLYVNSKDDTNKFDCNSYRVYLNVNSIRKEFLDILQSIVYGVSTNKKTNVRKFAYTLYIYTMWLYYINTSWGWKFENINYETMWNLALYLLSFVKPFEPDYGSEKNWLPFVKVSYVRYLFERRLWNGCKKGLKAEYYSLSKHLPLTTRYEFPEGMSRLQREMFKEQFKSPDKEVKFDRNKEIKRLSSEGKSIVWLANRFNLSISSIKRIVHSKF